MRRVMNFDRYKISISVLLGLLGFLGTFFSPAFEFASLNISFTWGLIFPMLVAITWGKGYGLIGVTFGLTGLYPFFIWPDNGWACFVSFCHLLIWIVLHGYASEMRRQSSKFFYNIYFVQFIASVLSVVIYLFIYPEIIQLNPPPWRGDTINQIAPEVIAIIIIKTIIDQFIVIALVDMLIYLPFIRKLFRLEVSVSARYSFAIIFSIISMSWLFTAVILALNHMFSHGDFSLSCLLTNLDGKDINILFLLTVFGAIVGGIAAKYLQSRLETEEVLKESEVKYRLLYDKMINGFIIYEPIYAQNGNMIDVRFIDVNPGYEKQSGLSAGAVSGKAWFEVFNSPNSNLEIYQKILQTGETEQFETYNDQTGRYYLCTAFKMKENQVGVMLDNITPYKKALAEIQKLNEELEQRVLQRTGELQGALNELETFAFTVSHDLKSPLRAIEGYSRFILEDFGESLDVEANEMVNNVKNISNDMIQLIDKLLEYSTSAKTGMALEMVNIEEKFVSVFKELKSDCPGRKVEIIFENNLPAVLADRILLKQALVNILNNAFKFTRKRDRAVITIGHEVVGEEYIFHVKDNGAGFDMDYSGKLFGIFQRLHTADEFEGSGIGLATIRKIIQKHGGRTWIEGCIDKGATVYFTLPVCNK
ncbi:MAG TPA: hypothetical protein DEF36_04795 [Desulfotomaculum sp.]|nr:hypothetical protein [Desulfotomaculum sp.]